MRTRLRRQDPANSERGAAAVEFALLLPLLVILVFGIIDFGRLLNAQLTLSESAREGARLAALNNPNACAKTAAAASTLGVTCGSGAINVTNCPSGSDQTTNGTVTVTYVFTFTTPLAAIVGSPSMTLTGKGVMPCGG